MINFHILKKGFYFLILTFVLTACETRKITLSGERLSIFEKEESETEFSNDKIILDRPYINEFWTSSSGNSFNTIGHIGGKKVFTKFAKNDIGVKTSSNQILYSPVANKDAVFTIDGKLKITATSLSTGKSLWINQKLASNDYLSYGALALDDERLYAITNNGILIT